jgi:CheY-like chemotaxis protein
MALQSGMMLVVDDDKINRVMLSNQLTMEGYDVVAAEHGREAIELLHTQPFDLVLLDLLMPEMDGFQVLAHMKADEHLRHLPVIVISALDEMGNVVRSIQMGATDHLLKPCDPFLLRARINASLAAKQLRDQEAEYMRQVELLSCVTSDLENGTFDPQKLAPVAARTDALGQLARSFLHMAQEVTMREQALQQQNKFQSILIKKISSDLRHPTLEASASLQAIQYYAENHMHAQLQEELRTLDARLQRGSQIIEQILAFATLADENPLFVQHEAATNT